VATDYYAALGVRRDAPPDEIKKAYRRLARELHPDVNPDPQTHERFNEITQAYEVLSDPGKRQMYDQGVDPLAPNGDLFLEILQRPHPIFERQGDDLHCTVTIPMVAAALGASLSVETLDGPRDLDIRPGTQSGQVIPMYSLGVQHLNDSGRGDLIIHVTVETPSKLDAEQESLLRQLAKLRNEEAPPGKFQPGQQGFFSRLRDAFNGR
jgi:DnaJ-class molecular chaperone